MSTPDDFDAVQDPNTPATGPEAPVPPGTEDSATDAESGHGQETGERKP